MHLRRTVTTLVVGLGLLLPFLHSSISQANPNENTPCHVRDNSDALNEDEIYPTGSLRFKIEYGYNRSRSEAARFCGEKIDFNFIDDDGNEIPDDQPVTIKLTKPLHINNLNDVDCDGPDDLCNDRLTFILDGSSHPGGVIIDTTGLQDDKCAIKVSARAIAITGITIHTKQPNKVFLESEASTGNSNGQTGSTTSSPEAADAAKAAVICDDGNSNNYGNNYDGVTLTHPPRCGDKKIDEGEECDDGDGNNSEGKACSAECKKQDVGNDRDGDGIADDVDNCTPERVAAHNHPADAIAHMINPNCPNNVTGLRVFHPGFPIPQTEEDCKPMPVHINPPSFPIVTDLETASHYDPAEFHNPDQADCDKDNLGDKCDNDWDNDKVADGVDNCAPVHPTDPNACDPTLLNKSANADQKNLDAASEPEDAKLGDVCDDDRDGDGNLDNVDRCRDLAPPQGLEAFDLIDADGDGFGVLCDPDGDGLQQDDDHDGVPDNNGDNCPGVSNPAPQLDTDGDFQGDACDLDDDNDGLTDAEEIAGCQSPTPLNPLNKDSDGDGLEDNDALDPSKTDPCPCDPNLACDGTPSDDTDNDGVLDISDNCPNHLNPAPQADSDGDGIGDACDLDNPDVDTDLDGRVNGSDNCPPIPNADQSNRDGDSQGDACDLEPDVNNDPVPTDAGGGCALGAAAVGGLTNGYWFLTLFLVGTLGLRRRKK